MTAAYLHAAIPEPVQILGLPLRPFSLGHWLLLSRFDNSFLTGRATGVDDIILAILVCSMSFEEGLKFLSAPDREEQITSWSKKLKHKFRQEGQTLDFAEKAELFKAYFDAGMVIPNYSATESGTASVGSPWPQVLKLTLMSELGMTETDVLNRPLRLSWWDYLGWRELNNKGIKLIADLDGLAAAQKVADEFEAKVRANPQAWGIR